MANADENAVFERLAKQYAEDYGEKLKLEAIELERQNIEYITPGLDKKVRKIGRNSLRHYTAGFAVLAAGLLLVLMLPNLLNTNIPSVTAPESHVAEAPAAAAEDAPPAASAEPAQPPELLPLNFTLPVNFTVAGKELDNGKSVYYLSDSNLDDVVMTMELDTSEDVFAGLKPLTINNSQAYYKYSPDFSMLAFEHDSITYVLTCKHDVNTLIPLGEAIL